MKNAKYYKKLKYRMTLEFYPEDDCYFVKFPELPGCIADGETPERALKKALEVKNEWIDAAIEAGWKIPEPVLPIENSGRITLRLPKSVHKKVEDRAEQEGVSLNQLILTYVVRELERSEANDNYKKVGTQLDEIENKIDNYSMQKGFVTDIGNKFIEDDWPVKGFHQKNIGIDDAQERLN